MAPMAPAAPVVGEAGVRVTPSTDLAALVDQAEARARDVQAQMERARMASNSNIYSSGARAMARSKWASLNTEWRAATANLAALQRRHAQSVRAEEQARTQAEEQARNEREKAEEQARYERSRADEAARNEREMAERTAADEAERSRKGTEDRSERQRHAQEVWRYAKDALRLPLDADGNVAGEWTETHGRVGRIAAAVQDGAIGLDDARAEIEDLLPKEPRPSDIRQDRSEGRDASKDALNFALKESEALKKAHEGFDQAGAPKAPATEDDRRAAATRAYQRWLSVWGDSASEEQREATWAAIAREFGGG
jgi:hypothetical protein